MDVRLINQFFWPDVAATAQLLADLAEDLAAAGWEVEALAGRGSYLGKAQGSLARRQEWQGVRIRRVWCTSFGRGSAIGRLVDYVTFLISAGLAVLLGRPSRVVVCLSTPPLVAMLGVLASWRGSRFVYKVEDLYPEIAVALGTLRNGSLLTRALTAVSRRSVRRADAVVCLDVGMRAKLVAQGSRRVEVVANWADGFQLRPDVEAGKRFRAAHGIGESFVVMYSGNLGLAHRFDAVLDAARSLAQERPEVLLLFVGDGARRSEVDRAAGELCNVRRLDYQSRERLSESYNAADVHLITLRDEAAGLLVPSKYSAALAAGKPVLLVGGTTTEMATEIEAEQVGWVSPHRGSDVLAAVASATGDRACLAAKAARARALFDRKYDRRQATAAWQRLLSEVATGERST